MIFLKDNAKKNPMTHDVSVVIRDITSQKKLLDALLRKMTANFKMKKAISPSTVKIMAKTTIKYKNVTIFGRSEYDSKLGVLKFFPSKIAIGKSRHINVYAGGLSWRGLLWNKDNSHYKINQADFRVLMRAVIKVADLTPEQKVDLRVKLDEVSK